MQKYLLFSINNIEKVQEKSDGCSLKPRSADIYNVIDKGFHFFVRHGIGARIR